jgi:voltage-gated potassium channel
MHILTRWELVQEILNSRIGNAVKGLFTLLVVGTMGFYALGILHQHGVIEPRLAAGEHWSLIDCLYFTAITLTTVGYGETLSSSGSLQNYPDVRMFNVALLLGGMIATAYFLSSATAFFVEGDLKRVLERRRMLKQIAQLQDHYIVCGAGQTGRHIAEELAQSNKPCVVIDAETGNIAAVSQMRVHSIIGDATKDETLMDAGIERARGLAACLHDDKDNLFLTISARQLNPKLRIISKAVDLPTRAKLLKAGADSVVSSAYIGGLRMASELVRPAVVNFLDQMLRNKEAPVRFAEVKVGIGCRGKKLGDLEVQKRCGLPILAIKSPRTDGFVYNPGPDTLVSEDSVLVVMGEVDRVHKLEEIVSAAQGASTFLGGGGGPPTAKLGAPLAPEPATSVRAAEELKDPRDNL